MAITKTSYIEVINLQYADADSPPAIEYRIRTEWDDPDDDDLPMVKSSYVTLHKTVTSMTTDTETLETTTTETETDISGEPQAIKDIAAVVWA